VFDVCRVQVWRHTGAFHANPDNRFRFLAGKPRVGDGAAPGALPLACLKAYEDRRDVLNRRRPGNPHRFPQAQLNGCHFGFDNLHGITSYEGIQHILYVKTSHFQNLPGEQNNKKGWHQDASPFYRNSKVSCVS
jgi:hypothetical protein